MSHERKALCPEISENHKFADGDCVVISGLRYFQELNGKFKVSVKKIAQNGVKNVNKI